MTLILSGTDGLSDVDGSAATPAIRGTDANTGIFFPAADTIAFSEGGVEAMRIDSSGNVGIGTASPASDARLTLASPTTESYVMFSRTNSGVFDAAVGNNAGSLVFKGGADSATVAGLTEFMRIDSSGNVGIGTSSPTEKLDVSGAISTTSNAANFNQAKTTLDYASGAGRIAAYISTGSNLQFYTNPNAGNVAERMRIDSSGNLLVGKTTTNNDVQGLALYPDGQMRMTTNGTASNTIIGFFRNSSATLVGQISTTSTATTYTTSSDYRLKHDIQPMTGALSKVEQLNPVTYKWKSDGSDSQGFIAHELQAIVPECVVGEKDAVDAEGNPVYQGIDTSFLVATLTAAIQEQQAIITQLQADVASLQAPQGTP